jgi:hypothetical protein
MAQKLQLSQNPFSWLPVELRQAILCEIQTAGALEAALQADQAFLFAFRGSESAILDTIVRNLIPPRLLPDVFALLASRKTDEEPWTKDEVSSIMDRYTRRQLPVQFQWTLDEALYILRLDENIQFFADDFVAAAFAEFLRARIRPPRGVPDSPSATERCRIAGAFYRFELYCNLFRRRGVVDDDNDIFPAPVQAAIFLNRFAPWENEQLGCVHNYLVDKIYPGTEYLSRCPILFLVTFAYSD